MEFFQLVFFSPQRDADFLDVLVSSQSVEGWIFFEAVHLAPPAASWSRLRSSTTAGTPSTPITFRTLKIVVVGPAADREKSTIQL